MIDRVTFERTTYAPAPQRFEAGTPAIIEAIGFAAAVDYIDAIGVAAIEQHETALVARLRDALRGMNISITTTAKTDEEARALLGAFKFPFKN